MRITCPSCGTQYDVDENDIAFSGQEVQCSECQEIWIQKRDGSVLALDTDEPEETVAPKGDEAPAEEPAEPGVRPPEETEKVKEVWDEISELAKTTEDDPEEEPDESESDEADEEPETDFPPIQETPAVVDEPANEQANDRTEKPWESDEIPEDDAAAEEVSGILDEIEDAIEITETEDELSEKITPEAEEDGATGENEESDVDKDEKGEEDDESDVKLRLVSDADADEGEDEAVENEDEFDEDELLKTFRTQIEIEDELEANPPPVDENVTPLPADLIGRRARGANIDAVKESIRSADTGESAVTPRNRFRRGFILPLLLLAIVAAIYVFSGSIVAMVPALAPVVNSVIAFVDVVRSAAAGVGNLILGLINRS